MPFFTDKLGKRQEVILPSTLYREAKEANLTPRQFINSKYETCEEVDTFTQMCDSEGLHFKANEAYGLNSTPMSVILNPPVSQASNVTRENPVQSRILFPPALLSAIDATLASDYQSPTAIFNKMVAITTTVPSARTEQPTVSYSGNDGPEDFRSQQISQLAEPANMMVITASDVTRQIPTFSMGLAISDQALQYATLQLVSLSLARQKSIEMFSRAGEALLAMLQGDADNGQSALSSVTAKSFDSSISAAGTITELAWMSWLYNNPMQCQIDWVIVDSLATALAIQGRSGKPTNSDDDPNSPRIDTLINTAYPQIAKNVQLFIAPSDWSWPANTLMGFQSSAAIAKLVNSSADYEAAERWALRRGEAMRFDFGESMYRLFDDAFSILTLTV